MKHSRATRPTIVPATVVRRKNESKFIIITGSSPLEKLNRSRNVETKSVIPTGGLVCHDERGQTGKCYVVWT